MDWLKAITSSKFLISLSNWKAGRKENKYNRRKRKKIALYAEKYGVKKFKEYRFDSSNHSNMDLDALKSKLLEDRITMLGPHKLDTLRFCVEDCLSNGIDGDLIETGVWKGGATIYMAGVLKKNGDSGKKIFVADSFEGLPPPDVAQWPQDTGDTHHTQDHLAISLEQVKEHFKSFDLYADNIVFVKGFFEDSLKTANIDKLSVLRLDGDMYGSTMTVLKQLYHKLEIGGYLILDDWLLKGARDALLDFREKMGIKEKMYEDFSGVFWKKTMTTNEPEW